MNDKTFRHQYAKLITEVLSNGITEYNNRTKHEIKVLRGGYDITLDMAGRTIPLPGGRKIWLKSAAAEVAWFLLGTTNADFIIKYTPMWDKFLDDKENKIVKAAYGYRWRKHFGRDQLNCAIMSLYNNPSDRQVVVSAWDPASDAMGTSVKKNVPCPVMFVLNSLPRGNNSRELNLFLFIRSSDIFVGLPYDVIDYALLLQAIVCELSIISDYYWHLGILKISIAHAHLYDSHYDIAKDTLSHYNTDIIEPFMPQTWSISRIEADPHGYVEEVKAKEKELVDNLPIMRPEVIE